MKGGKNMKKVISILAAVIMAGNIFALSANALDFDTPAEEIVIEDYAIFNGLMSSLSISSSTATCTSSASASTAKTISATQTLEKYSGWFWSWDTVSGATWSKSENSTSILMYNTKSGLSAGKYRLKTVFIVTSTSGQTETVTVYSSEKTIS